MRPFQHNNLKPEEKPGFCEIFVKSFQSTRFQKISITGAYLNRRDFAARVSPAGKAAAGPNQAS